MSENTNEHRLPPPAFPPGQRRHVHRNSVGKHEVVQESPDGFIAPDAPLPPRLDPIEQAFISPDDPIPERVIELAPEFQDYARPVAGDGEGEVVGMDLDTQPDPIDVLVQHDPYVAELVAAIRKLAESLGRKGEAGLRASSEMSRFEQTLRAYCSGYLAGRRVEEPPLPPAVEEY